MKLPSIQLKGVKQMLLRAKTYRKYIMLLLNCISSYTELPYVMLLMYYTYADMTHQLKRRKSVNSFLFTIGNDLQLMEAKNKLKISF